MTPVEPGGNPSGDSRIKHKTSDARVAERRERVVHYRGRRPRMSWRQIADAMSEEYRKTGRLEDLPAAWNRSQAYNDFMITMTSTATATRENLDALRGIEDEELERYRDILDHLLAAAMPIKKDDGTFAGGNVAVATNVVNMLIRTSESKRKLWAADDPPPNVRKVVDELFKDSGLPPDAKTQVLKRVEEILAEGR